MFIAALFTIAKRLGTNPNAQIHDRLDKENVAHIHHRIVAAIKKE